MSAACTRKCVERVNPALFPAMHGRSRACRAAGELCTREFSAKENFELENKLVNL